jgi:putative hydrolase of the HAD superfamily
MAVSALRAIFFDLDDTLYSTSEFALRARRNSVEAMVKAGLRADPSALLAELIEVVEEFSSNYERHFDQLLQRLPRRLYRGVNPAIIVAAGVAAYHDTKFRYLCPYEDAYEVLRDLARTELIRGVITAGLANKQAEKLVRLRIAPLLSPGAIFISDQLGINKPNIKMYQRACSDLNLKPAESMYVGDNAAMDIEPAKRIGMLTVHVIRGSTSVGKGAGYAPDWIVGNFWELLDVLRDHLGVVIPPRTAEGGPEQHAPQAFDTDGRMA